DAYLPTKVAVVGGLAVIQTALLSAVVFGIQQLRAESGKYVATVLVLLASMLAANALALLVSALVRTEDQASSLIPFLLIPQLLFGGLIKPIGKLSETVQDATVVIFARWSFQGVGGGVDLEGAAEQQTAAARAF